MVKVEVQSGGFALENGTTVFAEEAVIRPFVQRFMYQKYVQEDNTYVKTLMSDNANMDLKDTKGDLIVENSLVMLKTSMPYLRLKKIYCALSNVHELYMAQ